MNFADYEEIVTINAMLMILVVLMLKSEPMLLNHWFYYYWELFLLKFNQIIYYFK